MTNDQAALSKWQPDFFALTLVCRQSSPPGIPLLCIGQNARAYNETADNFFYENEL